MTAPALSEALFERATVGGCMADPRRIAEVATIVKQPDFTSADCGWVFEALVQLDGAAVMVDTLTVASQLQQMGVLSKIGGKGGGLAFLAELDTAAPTAANVMEYARRVADLSLRRKAVRVLQDAAAAGLAGVGTTEELIAGTEAKLLELFGAGGNFRRERKFDVIIDDSIDLFDANRRSIGGVTGLRTGLVDLDRMLTGLHPGELIIVAARPGGGKSVFGLQAAVHAALHEQQAVLVFSVEMPGEQLGLRSLASEGLLPLSRLRGSGALSDNELARFNETSARLRPLPIWVDDSPTLNLVRLRAVARRLRLQAKLGLIVIDYLQLMDGPKGDGREQEVAANTRGLKALAKELGVPIVALAQLNRKAEDNAGPPKLSHLRESGAIEQDADVIIFLHAEPSEDDTSPRAGLEVPTDLHVAKQRNGATGPVPVIFHKEYLRLVNRAVAEPQPELPLPAKPRPVDFTQPPEAD